MSAVLRFRNVTLGYDRHPAVHHLDGEVEAGALLAVVGPNGAGKSTLFRGIVGLLKPLAGAIGITGLAMRDIAFLPQSADLDRSFPISVFDFVGTGLWHHSGMFGRIGRAGQDRIRQALTAVGLSGFERRAIGTRGRPGARGCRGMHLLARAQTHPGMHAAASAPTHDAAQ